MMSRIFLVMIFIILLTNFSSSLDFGISPNFLNIKGNISEMVCENFTLRGENFTFLGDVKWSKNNSRDVKDYKFSSEDYGIKTNFPMETTQGKNKICFVIEKEGNYSGVLIYKIKESNYGIGTWIGLEINKSKKENRDNLLSLTGFSVNDNARGFLQKINILYFIFIFDFLSVALLIYFLRKKF